MFKALLGDLFASQAQTRVNTVNCVGIMGKGVAQEFKKRYPAMFEDYAERCAQKQVRLGEPYLFRDRSGILIGPLDSPIPYPIRILLSGESAVQIC